MHPALDELTRDVAEKQRAHLDAFQELQQQSVNAGGVLISPYLENWIRASSEMEAAAKALRERALDIYDYPADHPLRRLTT